jgi:hypothetical protein
MEMELADRFNPFYARLHYLPLLEQQKDPRGAGEAQGKIRRVHPRALATPNAEQGIKMIDRIFKGQPGKEPADPNDALVEESGHSFLWKDAMRVQLDFPKMEKVQSKLTQARRQGLANQGDAATAAGDYFEATKAYLRAGRLDKARASVKTALGAGKGLNQAASIYELDLMQRSSATGIGGR